MKGKHGMIELINVEKTYYSKAGDIHALNKTNLHIKEGEIFGIIGLSGAGKSTLVRCINMLEANRLKCWKIIPMLWRALRS